jgi:hypothetical protein
LEIGYAPVVLLAAVAVTVNVYADDVVKPPTVNVTTPLVVVAETKVAAVVVPPVVFVAE